MTPAASDALDVMFVVPESVDPFVGDVIDVVGGVVSEPGPLLSPLTSL